jgi:hypothetical protein
VVKIAQVKLLSHFVMSLKSGKSRDLAISIERDSRAINVTKEVLFHLRVVDVKRKIVRKSHISCFRG